MRRKSVACETMFKTRLGNTQSKTFAALVERDKRIIGFSDETDLDGFFIYTNSAEWCDDCGSGTFRGDTVTDAIRKYKRRVQRPTPAGE